jgi:hypothetical protein
MTAWLLDRAADACGWVEDWTGDYAEYLRWLAALLRSSP